jgi:hypothetical protein
VKRLIALGALALAATTLAGCVSDGYGHGRSAYWHHRHHDGDGYHHHDGYHDYH